jgi:hypothetical protein
MSAESQRLPSSHRTLLGAQYARSLAGALTAFGRAHQLQSALTWALRLLALGLGLDLLALALARAWPARGAAARLSEIHVDPGEGVTLYVGDEGTQVRLGTGDYEAKLTRLDKVLSALGAEGKKADVVHLDNRLHPSWVTVRLAGVDAATGGGR